MITDEIKQYVDERRADGYSEDEIKGALTASGWSARDIADILKPTPPPTKKYEPFSNIARTSPKPPKGPKPAATAPAKADPSAMKKPKRSFSVAKVLLKVIFWLAGAVSLAATTYEMYWLGVSMVHNKSFLLLLIQQGPEGLIGNSSAQLILGSYALGLIAGIISLLYIIALFRLRRWTVPIIAISSLGATATAVAAAVHDHAKTTEAAATAVLAVLLLSVIIYFRRHLQGSMHNLKFQIPLLLILLPSIAATSLYALYPDDPSVNDSDLILPSIPALPKADNAYYVLPTKSSLTDQQNETLKSVSELSTVSPTSSLLKLTPRTIPRASQVLASSSDLTNMVLAAAAKPGFQCPTTVNQYGANTPLCSLNTYRQLATVAAADAQLEGATGHATSAIQTALALAHFGSMLNRPHTGPLITYLEGISITNLGLNSLQTIIDTNQPLASSTRQMIITQLQQDTMPNDSLVWSLKSEYMYAKQGTAAFWQYHNYFLEANKTLNAYAQMRRLGVLAVGAECGSSDLTRKESAANDYAQQVRQEGVNISWIPNMLGRWSNSFTASSLTTTKTHQCDLNARIAKLQAELQ